MLKEVIEKWIKELVELGGYIMRRYEGDEEEIVWIFRFRMTAFGVI